MRLKKAKKKKPSISKLKKIAWDLLSKIKRLEYSDKAGYVQCYTCGRKLYWKKAQAGHGFSGRGNAILFEEDIIRPQCYGCNCCSSGKLDIFTYNLRTEHGDEKFDYLWRLKHTQKKFHTWELEERILVYKKRLQELIEKNLFGIKL